MQGPTPLDTPEQVREFWKGYAAKMRETGRPYTLTRSRRKLHAYVSDGRWVADCECGDGVALWRENPDACCLGCGTVYSNIEWPDEIEEAERVLSARRSAGDRGWRPHEGETLDDLKIENLTRGVPLEPEA